MPCELWVGGYGQPGTGSAARSSPLPGAYYEFLVKIPTVAPTEPETRLPQRLNAGKTNDSYDDYNHAVGVAVNVCVYPNGMWNVNRPPKYFYKGSCPPEVLGTALDPSQRHDCINGNCLPATVYKTAGFYNNLADCQAGCAKNSKCLGECVPTAELAALQAAANAVRERLC